jgi:hypothetical protein
MDSEERFYALANVLILLVVSAMLAFIGIEVHDFGRKPSPVAKCDCSCGGGLRLPSPTGRAVGQTR